MAFVNGFTLPYYLVINAGMNTVAADYPEVIGGFLAAQTGNDTASYDLWGEVTDSTGAVFMDDLGTKMTIGRTTLSAPMAAEASTLVPSFNAVPGSVQPEVAQLVFIGTGDDENMEIALIQSSSGSGWTLNRGVLDTVPRAWPAGTPVWFLPIDATVYDSRALSAGDTIDYKLLSVTSKGILALEDAPVVSLTLDERPYRPLRPANVRINSTAFGELTGAGIGPWTVSWSNRNRLTEDSQILPWTSGTVVPEAGQETKISILNTTTRAVINTVENITGTSYSLPLSAFGGASQAIVRVTSTRGGYESLQGHEIIMRNIG